MQHLYVLKPSWTKTNHTNSSLLLCPLFLTYFSTCQQTVPTIGAGMPLRAPYLKSLYGNLGCRVLTDFIVFACVSWDTDKMWSREMLHGLGRRYNEWQPWLLCTPEFEGPELKSKQPSMTHACILSATAGSDSWTHWCPLTCQASQSNKAALQWDTLTQGVIAKNDGIRNLDFCMHMHGHMQSHTQLCDREREGGNNHRRLRGPWRC